MCRRKQNTKRRARTANVSEGGGFSEPQTSNVNPVDDRLNYVEPVPEARLVETKDGLPVKAATLEPGEGLVLPTKGKAGLKRVFLGLGWAATDGQVIDVDCCAAPFVKGSRVDPDTVWFGNLHNTMQDNYCTIKHSGDILSGQEGKGELEDLERIYVDLENMAENIDCLAFEGNIYSAGTTFSALENAYIRLVNADTNQEIARCSLGSGLGDKERMSSRVLLFAKMYRGKDRWVLHTVTEARAEELRKLPPGTMPDFVPPGGESSAPEAQVMDRGGTVSDVKNPVAGGETAKGNANAPKRSYLMPAIAVASVVGIAAAVALFGPSPLDVGSIAPGNFTDGVDFGSLVNLVPPTDCGCCHDCECLGANLGDVCGDCGDGLGNLCKCGPCFNGCGCENPLDGLCGGIDPGCICGPVGSLCESAGDVCGDGLDGLQGCVEGCMGAECFDQLTDCSAVGAVLGGCFETVSSCDIGGALGGCVEGLSGAVVACTSCVGAIDIGAIGQSCSGIGENCGAIAGALCDICGTVVDATDN